MAANNLDAIQGSPAAFAVSHDTQAKPSQKSGLSCGRKWALGGCVAVGGVGVLTVAFAITSFVCKAAFFVGVCAAVSSLGLIGIGIGGVALIAIGAIGIWILLKKKHKKPGYETGTTPKNKEILKNINREYNGAYPELSSSLSKSFVGQQVRGFGVEKHVYEKDSKDSRDSLLVDDAPKRVYVQGAYDFLTEVATA